MNDKARGFLLLDHTICLLFLLQRLFKPFFLPSNGLGCKTITLDAKLLYTKEAGFCVYQLTVNLCHDSLSIGSFATTTK